MYLGAHVPKSILEPALTGSQKPTLLIFHQDITLDLDKGQVGST